MKQYNVGEIVVLILSLTVATFIIVIAIGMLKTGATTPENSAARIQVLDWLKYISGAIIGVVSTMLSQKNKS